MYEFKEWLKSLEPASYKLKPLKLLVYNDASVLERNFILTFEDDTTLTLFILFWSDLISKKS